MASGADADFNVTSSRASVIDRAARADDIGLLIFRMNVRFHVQKRARNLAAEGQFASEDEIEDPILEAWEAVRKGTRPRRDLRRAGKVARTFAEIEEGADIRSRAGTDLHPAKWSRFKSAIIRIGPHCFLRACGTACRSAAGTDDQR